MSYEAVVERYAKYLENLKDVFSQLELKKFDGKVPEIIDLARRYFEDAKYFKNNNKPVTALISLAYCEGLLDALRLVGCINFKWVVGENGNKK